MWVFWREKPWFGKKWTDFTAKIMIYVSEVSTYPTLRRKIGILPVVGCV